MKSKKDERRSGAKFLGFSFAPVAKSRDRQEETAAKKMAKGIAAKKMAKGIAATFTIAN